MPDKPIMPNLEISTVVGCKMGCDYCPQKLHTREYLKRDSKTIMSFADFALMISDVPKEVEIIFAGMAEPWLNPKCTEMLLLAHQLDHRIGVYTTLEGMRLQDIEQIWDINFLHFCIHLPDADGLMKFKMTDNYLMVLEACIKTIPNHNFACIGKLHQLVETITGPVADSSNTLISRAGNLKTLAITPKKGHLRCSAMSDKMDHNILLPNGDILICCMDYSQQHVIGNLLKMDYESLFKSEEYLKIKKGLKNDDSKILCRTCEIAENANS